MLKPPAVPELTVEVLIPWLREQRPDGEYVFSDPVFCMMGRFLADHGSQWGDVGYSEMPHYQEIAGARPWTYGAALERAQTLQLPPPSMLQLPAPRRELSHDRVEGR